MKLLVPPINISEEDGFLPEIDIFNRKPFGESLYNLVKNTDDELVLALDAPWGEGKSTFIKMWQGLLKQKGTCHIYFDAFENDYQQDPFLAISSQIYQLIDKDDKDIHQEYKEKATAALKVVGRAGLRIGIKALTAGILDETILEDTGSVKDTSTEASNLIDGFISNQLTKADEDRKSLKVFTEYLSTLSEKIGGDNPVIFIIDELDRCKPKFALSLLESIKHLFCVPNITFVLVMNRKQLEESVRCEYGSGVEAAKYLQKFVSIWTTLPKPEEEYNSISKKYIKNCLNRMNYEITSSTQETAIDFFEDIASYYDLSLREIERSLTSFAIIYNATEGKLNEKYSLMSVFLSVIKSIKPDIYKKLSNNNISYRELLLDTSLENLEADWWQGKPEGHPVKWLLKYYLSTDEEIKELLKEGDYFKVSHNFDRSVIIKICAWLEAFKRT